MVNTIFKYKTINGTIFSLRRNTFDSGVIIESWWLKSYTRHLKNVPSDAVIIDIGAHIGAFSLLAATKYTQSHIYAFEPSSENFALLNKNIKANNLEKRIKTFNIAVTDGKKKTITLNIHPSNLGMHSVVFDYNPGEKGQQHEVLTTSLDGIFSENKIKTCHLLKLDCEGAEYSILFAASKNTLEKINNIVMEYNDYEEIERLKKILADAGFKIMHYQTLPIPLPNAIKKLYRLKFGKAPILLAYRSESGRKTLE
jgi:FkbM family methyltransferase